MPKRHTTPAVVERCVARVAERLLPERGPRGALSGAYAICTAQAQRRGVLRPSTRALTAAGRAADRSARRRPGLARAERAVARIARDARKANGAAAPPWLDRSLPYYYLALDQIHRDDRPATAALNAADRSGDRARIARAEARYARVGRVSLAGQTATPEALRADPAEASAAAGDARRWSYDALGGEGEGAPGPAARRRKRNAARPPKGTPTHTNLFALREAFTGGGELASRVPNSLPPTRLPHLRRCLAAGLVRVEGRELTLTDAGVAALAAFRWP